MELSKKLVTDFVNATNDTKTETVSGYMYGTVVKNDDENGVRIDGSDIVTPVVELMSSKNGDRVLVQIDNHQARVLGNVTAPADVTSEEVVSEIVQRPGVISMIANNIDLTGKVSFNELASDLKSVKEGVTYINGGKIDTDELTAKKVLVQDADGNDIFNADGTVANPIVTIGGFSVDKDGLHIESDIDDVLASTRQIDIGETIKVSTKYDNGDTMEYIELKEREIYFSDDASSGGTSTNRVRTYGIELEKDWTSTGSFDWTNSIKPDRILLQKEKDGTTSKTQITPTDITINNNTVIHSGNIASSIISEVVTLGDNIECTSGSIKNISKSVAKTGYTPLGILGYGIYLASTGGTMATNCLPHLVTLAGSSATVEFKNTATVTAKVKVEVRVLYLKNS